MSLSVNGNLFLTSGNTTATFANVSISGLSAALVMTEPPPPPEFLGTVSGYASGGEPNSNIIDKFPFASDANATDVGDLTTSSGLIKLAGQSSPVSGYTSGGLDPVAYNHNTIDKFPFASDANATDVGDLSVGRYGSAGQSSEVSGYTSGSWYTPMTPPAGIHTIDKFPFASDANATDVGDLTVGRYSPAGQSSSVSGYSSGGTDSGFPGSTNIIDKFPFASDANATDVGDLTQIRGASAGQSSEVSGYTSGGESSGSPSRNTIDKFPFASDANATDVGDLTLRRYDTTGQSSTVSGYTSGGNSPSPIASDIIDKFPFASDANATDVGDLTLGRDGLAGQQH